MFDIVQPTGTVGTLMVGLDASNCVVMTDGDRTHTITNVDALVAALTEARIYQQFAEAVAAADARPTAGRRPRPV